MFVYKLVFKCILVPIILLLCHSTAFFHCELQLASLNCADEIDAIGKARGDDQGGSNEREQGLMQILYEMDGFYKNDKVQAQLTLNAYQR